MDNTKALVTGAARGIGRKVAERLAQDGFAVVAVDIDGDEVERQASSMRDAGLSVRGAAIDISDRRSVSALLEEERPIQVVVNCAALLPDMAPLDALTPEAIRRTLRINLLGNFILAQEAAARMERGGRIVNFASRGYLGNASGVDYLTSKGGVVGLTRGMAIELRWRGINVNAVAPGMTDTRMIGHYTPEERALMVSKEPAGRAADPGDIANAVSFLTSAQSAFVTGQILMVDGGKTLGLPPF